MINIPPSVTVTVNEIEPHTGSLDGLLHCTTKLQAVIVSGGMFTSFTSPSGPVSKLYMITEQPLQILKYIFSCYICNCTAT